MTPQPQVELALGTVQFGLAYGVAGRGEQVPEAEVRAILSRAWDMGIRVLDTASAYGSIEERLGHLMGDRDFRVVSKLAALPDDRPPAELASLAVASFKRSSDQLGRRLKALMFHRAEDLASTAGPAVWDALQQQASARSVSLGVSCYDPDTAIALSRSFDLRVVQLPGNALDQRIRTARLDPSVEVHLRSAFLQGLLLMPLETAALCVPAATDPLQRWHDWCQAHAVTPLQAALSIVKGWASHVQQCVVGVDSLAQLEQIAEQWHRARPIEAPELATDLAQAIDPRLWQTKD